MGNPSENAETSLKRSRLVMETHGSDALCTYRSGFPGLADTKIKRLILSQNHEQLNDVRSLVKCIIWTWRMAHAIYMREKNIRDKLLLFTSVATSSATKYAAISRDKNSKTVRKTSFVANI